MAVLPWQLSTYLALLTATKLYVNKKKGNVFLRFYRNNSVTLHVHGISYSLMTIWLGLRLVMFWQYTVRLSKQSKALDFLAPKRGNKIFRNSCICIPIYTASHPGRPVPSRCSQRCHISTSEWRNCNLKPVVTVLLPYPYPFIIHYNRIVRNAM